MRITGPLIKVLVALIAASQVGREPYGLELSRQTGLKGGTLYPILDRLEGGGWVQARWEEVEPADVKRPRRCFYSLTTDGMAEARRVLVEHGIAGFQWA
jgi:PadR family transcriptional regulator, regulatory protein PadR